MHEHHHASPTATWLEALFQVFTPRRVCMFEQPDVIWTHIVGDALIAFAYFSIPFALVYFASRRPDLSFGRTFALFAAFIFACGTTHLFQVWAIWQPLYRLEGIVKLVTAAVSLATSWYLYRHLGTALKIPSPEQLRAANAALEAEVGERRTAQEALRVMTQSLEERVRQRTAELERANRVKDEFLAVLSHELRTPLHSILGWTALVRKDPTVQGHDKVLRALDLVERNGRLQAQLINDLLDVSAMVTGSLRLEKADVDVAEVVRSTVEAALPGARKKDIAVEVALPDSLGIVHGDRVRLEQLFSNLLANAVKFTPKFGRITVSGTRRDGKAEVRVSDTGIGIDSDFLPFVFDRFRQADSSETRGYGGLGLGLAIVRALVEAHEGSVRAESEGRDRGSSFVVTLPLAIARDTVEAPREPGPVRAELGGLRALVVDDDESTRELVQATLAEAGLSVITAPSAEDARPLLATTPFDVLLCDLSMPGETGFDLLRFVRDTPGPNQHTTAIAVSALAREEDQRRSILSGFDAHVAKPVSPTELTRAVAEVLHAAREASLA
jgi:signal transduction histidine kinase/ActR/RegA family two-component response regulator